MLIIFRSVCACFTIGGFFLKKISVSTCISGRVFSHLEVMCSDSK